MRIFTIAAILVGLMPAGASAAHDSDSDTPRLSFDAYGTLGVVYSSEDRADFIGNLFQREGAGHSRQLSHKVDSRLGLQATAELTPRLSSVVQVVIEQQSDGRFTPGVEWANVKYDFTPDFSMRIGRMVQPTFMISEYRKIGYATPWVRPPEEVYRMIPVSNFDGIDFIYQRHFGRYTNTLRGTFGRNDSELNDGTDAHARGAMTLSNTLGWGDFSLFASITRNRLTIDQVNPLFDAFRQFGPEGEAIADRYDVDDSRFTTVAVGARYDPGHWFIMGEWGGSTSQTFIGDIRGAYVTVGYRIGAFTPYAGVARIRVTSETSDPGLSTEGLPPPLVEAAGQLNFVLNEMLASAARQKSLSLGTRWDFARSMALTMQYDYLDLASGSPGILVNTQPDFRPGGSASVVSLTLDFVF
ncbi:MAG: porin [Wenzhouxiangella sp.]